MKINFTVTKTYVKIDHFRYIKIQGNKTEEMYYSQLSVKMISLVLFPQASQPS